MDPEVELRTEDATVPQDWPALARYLSAHGMFLAVDPPPRQFAGGLANLNYLLSIDGKQAVLRRPPLGRLPPGAYDMEREFRILSKLNRGFPLAPRGLHLCLDEAVIGAPFQITEHRHGVCVRGASSPALCEFPNVAARLSNTVIDVLVQLHGVDPAVVRLEDLGKPQGFLQRAVEGWIKRASLSAQGRESSPCHTLIADLGRWLRAQRMDDGKSSLIHNDLKLDNLLLDPDTLAPTAVLDWDQCTQGDSLFDLATTLSYCTEPGDPPVMRRLRQMPSGVGFPTRRALAERYAKAMGRDLGNFQFYRVLAIFKLAIIFQQLHQRYREGATRDPRYADFGAIADGVLEFALLVARGERF
jgi:aminoglycoside phosphotransferase (APT) family kinase protein